MGFNNIQSERSALEQIECNERINNEKYTRKSRFVRCFRIQQCGNLKGCQGINPVHTPVFTFWIETINEQVQSISNEDPARSTRDTLITATAKPIGFNKSPFYQCQKLRYQEIEQCKRDDAVYPAGKQIFMQY